MANDDTIAARGGLLPVEYPYGNYRKNWYRLTTSAVAVYVGQPMDTDANGQVLPATASTANNYMLGPALGFADDQFTVGAAGGALPAAMLSLTAGPFMPALTNGWVLIADDPDQIFVMQAATDTAITTANLMDSTTFTYRSTSGNTTTGYSTAELSGTQCTTTGSGALQVIGLLPQRNSDGTLNSVGNYAKVKVRITNHRLGWRPVGIGAI